MGFTLKGRDVIKLEAIAKKLGKPYGEVFAEIVGRAHEQIFGAAKGQAETDPSSDSSAKANAQEAIEQVGEPHDGHVTEDSSNEHQDSPVMKGQKPNPLALSSAKRWASVKDDDEEDEESPRSVAKQRQGVARGKARRI